MRSKRRTVRRTTAAAVVLALALAACADDGSNGEDAVGDGAASDDEVVEITFRQFDPPAEVAGLQEALESFNADNPGIQVTMENTTNDQVLEDYVREVQAGDGPDIIHLGLVQVLSAGEPGHLLDLTPYLAEAPPGAGYDDFLATDLGEADGAVYGLPWSVDTFTIAYNEGVFSDAGISGTPDTWEDLHDTAVQIREATGEPGFCFPAGSGSNTWGWFLFNYHLWSNGATLVERDGDGWTVGADPDEVAATFAYMKSFFDDDATPESMISINTSSDPAITETLANGECGMAFMAPANFQAARDSSEMSLATFPVPEGSETRISHLGGRMLGINPNSEHPDEAWEVVRYLVSAEIFDQYYGQFPAQESLLDEVEFDDALSGYVAMLPLAQTFEVYVNSPTGVPPLWAQTGTEMGEVLTGQKSPDEAGASLVDFVAAELDG